MKMKRLNVFKGVLLLCLCLASGAVQAQDWKSILSSVASAVTGDKNITGFSLEGTWNYVGPDCKFTSDNLLAKAGGEVASKKVEDKMGEVLAKLGFTDGCTYVFNADSTYTSTVKGRTTKGTYSYNASTKELQMKTRLGLKFSATVSQSLLDGNKMSLLFKADKLMSLAQSVSGKLGSSSSNSTISTASSLLGEYDGLELGFELQKQ